MRLLLLLLTCIGQVSASTLYQIGNSLTYDSYPHVGAFVDLANSQGQNITENGWHVRAGKQLNYIYDNPDDPSNLVGPSGNWVNALSNYSWDYVTMQPSVFGTSTLGTDITAIQNWINLATNVNPNTKFYIYAAWPYVSTTQTYSEQWLSPVPNDLNQPTLHHRDYFDHLLSALQSLTSASVDVIPIGEVWYRIDQQAGSLDHITSAYDLFRDTAHSNDIGRSVIAWTMYAKLFGESVVGVDLPEIYSAKPEQGPFVMDDALALQLQNIVDDVVLSSTVPLPAAVWMFGFGLLGMVGIARRKKAALTV